MPVATRHLRNHQAAGFTLLELLVAIAVFAVMSVMAYGGLNSVIANNTRSVEALERLQAVQRAVFTLGRDLGQIVQRDIRDEYGNVQAYLSTSTNLDYLIEFTRGGRRNPANLRRSSMMRVAYRLEDETLSRLFWQELDRAQGSEPYETVLLDNVQTADFRYLDADGDWHDQWPPLNTSDEVGASGVSMLAIEIKLQLQDWGEIVRLIKMQDPAK